MSQVTNLELRVVDESKSSQEKVDEVVNEVDSKKEEVIVKTEEVVTKVEEVVAKVEEIKEKVNDVAVDALTKVVKNDIIQDANVRKVVELLVNDANFLKRVEDAVKNILSDGKVDEKDVPEFVFLIMDSYNTVSKMSLTRDELPTFVKAVFDFIVTKFNLLKEEDRLKIEAMVSSSVKLAMMIPAINNVVDVVAKKCWCW